MAAVPALQSVPVNLGPRSYTVQVGSGLLSGIGTEVAEKMGERKSCAVITDSNVGPLYADAVLESLRAVGKNAHLITVPAGEASKSLLSAQTVCGEMVRAGLDRKSFVVALGGGVIGDLGGFCASIFQRGIPYVQVPTTVLSQVDSSVGGKTGVNLPDAKNMVGAFHQPLHVIADVATLDSLHKREWNEGFAEIIKHACIRDASMLEAIDAVADGAGDMADLIRRNIAIKAAIVEADEYETLGLRALLNFGHTLGHAVEAAAGYGAMLHGEAISLGLRAAAWLSVKRAGLLQTDCDRIIALLQKFELPTRLPEGFDTDELLRITRMDKKFETGKIRFVLLPKLGEAFVSKDVTEADLIAALDEIRK
ncbi:3-dehydroquinate synthase [Prosthecobacter fusiformis]|uniref:3-dehydroquinate synthase n=1 Tax=Prosthecobacter fusiformis TaxID=48464 RepID=A0A4R7S669_9BACT|nr:3-dehydroquinate synthase [Prosthecobacter fusiformis]TDU72915.1 3-dehydroquinate synthase [Prosthecobacter fusiformis]